MGGWLFFQEINFWGIFWCGLLVRKSLKHFHKSKFVHQRTQEDEHYRENPSNHDLLTVMGVDRRAFLKMFRAQITVYCTCAMRHVLDCVGQSVHPPWHDSGHGCSWNCMLNHCLEDSDYLLFRIRIRFDCSSLTIYNYKCCLKQCQIK